MRYATEIRKGYLGQIEHPLYQTKKKDIVIWATDNNGQISRNPEMATKLFGNGPFLTWENSIIDVIAITPL